MKCATLIILLAGSTLAFAQDKPAPAPNTPTISDAHQKQFFKAQLAVNEAHSAMEQAKAQFQAAIDEITKDCGDKHQPTMGPQGDPVCIAKPQSTTKEATGDKR